MNTPACLELDYDDALGCLFVDSDSAFPKGFLDRLQLFLINQIGHLPRERVEPVFDMLLHQCASINPDRKPETCRVIRAVIDAMAKHYPALPGSLTAPAQNDLHEENRLFYQRWTNALAIGHTALATAWLSHEKAPGPAFWHGKGVLTIRPVIQCPDMVEAGLRTCWALTPVEMDGYYPSAINPFTQAEKEQTMRALMKVFDGVDPTTSSAFRKGYSRKLEQTALRMRENGTITLPVAVQVMGITLDQVLTEQLRNGMLAVAKKYQKVDGARHWPATAVATEMARWYDPKSWPKKSPAAQIKLLVSEQAPMTALDRQLLLGLCVLMSKQDPLLNGDTQKTSQQFAQLAKQLSQGEKEPDSLTAEFWQSWLIEIMNRSHQAQQQSITSNPHAHSDLPPQLIRRLLERFGVSLVEFMLMHSSPDQGRQLMYMIKADPAIINLMADAEEAGVQSLCEQRPTRNQWSKKKLAGALKIWLSLSCRAANIWPIRSEPVLNYWYDLLIDGFKNADSDDRQAVLTKAREYGQDNAEDQQSIMVIISKVEAACLSERMAPDRQAQKSGRKRM